MYRPDITRRSTPNKIVVWTIETMAGYLFTFIPIALQFTHSRQMDERFPRKRRNPAKLSYYPGDVATSVHLWKQNEAVKRIKPRKRVVKILQ